MYDFHKYLVLTELYLRFWTTWRVWHLTKANEKIINMRITAWTVWQAKEKINKGTLWIWEGTFETSKVFPKLEVAPPGVRSRTRTKQLSSFYDAFWHDLFSSAYCGTIKSYAFFQFIAPGCDKKESGITRIKVRSICEHVETFFNEKKKDTYRRSKAGI